MHIKRHTKNSKRLLFCVMVFVMLIGGISCGTEEIKKENDNIDFKEYFAHYDKMLGNDIISTSYDVREMELQIDGFWDYYERYDKQRKRYKQYKNRNNFVYSNNAIGDYSFSYKQESTNRMSAEIMDMQFKEYPINTCDNKLKGA